MPLVLGASIAGKSARASDDAEAVGLQYRAPASCPNEVEFVRLVRGKTDKFHPGPSLPGHRLFRVSVDGEGPSRGELLITGGQVPEARRTVEGDTCAEIVSALALATALAVDPHSFDLPVATSAPLTALPPPSEPMAPLIVPPAPTTLAVLPPAAAPVQRPVTPEPGWTWGLGVQGAAAFGVAPNPLLGGGLGVQLRDRPTHPRVVYKVDVEYQSSKPEDFLSARIGFDRALARLGACPLTHPIGGADAMVCAHVALGLLAARSQDVPRSTRDTGFWGSAGASLVLQFDLGREFSLDLTGGFDAAFRRDRYYLRPDEEAHRVPAVAGLAGLGIFRSLR